MNRNWRELFFALEKGPGWELAARKILNSRNLILVAAMHSNSAFLIDGTCSFTHEQRYVPGTELVNESIGMNKLQAQSDEAQSSTSNNFNWYFPSAQFVSKESIASLRLKHRSRFVAWRDSHGARQCVASGKYIVALLRLGCSNEIYFSTVKMHWGNV